MLQRGIREFLKVRNSYDVLPLSCRLIVFDNELLIKKSLNILIQNGEPALDALRACITWWPALTCVLPSQASSPPPSGIHARPPLPDYLPAPTTSTSFSTTASFPTTSIR